MGIENFFLYGNTHVIKRKSSDNYAEKFALLMLLYFPCNLMDNFYYDFFLFFHGFFRSIFSSTEFSPAFYGKCLNLPDGTSFWSIPSCEPIVLWLACQALDHEVEVRKMPEKSP
jgi:hypothetical protein